MSHLQSGLALSALCLCFAVPAARSEQVTLGFEAEIVRVFDTAPFDAGVSFELGDKITGRFTFEPDDVGGGAIPGIPTAFESQQSTRAFIDINGVEFSTPDAATGITIQSRNNSLGTVFGLTDSISVGGAIAPSDPVSVPSVSADLSGFNFFVEAPSDVLPAATIPADPAVWNQLHDLSFTAYNGNLNLTLHDGSGGSIGFAATLKPGSFFLVPEPAAGALLALIALSHGCTRRE